MREALARRLRRLLDGLVEVETRVAWLREQAQQTPLEPLAEAFDALCEDAERAPSRARGALLPLALLVARDRETAHVVGLRSEALLRHRVSLARLLRRGVEEARPVAVKPPVPNYRGDRELTVGERRSLARKPTRAAFDKLLADPHPLVLEQVLQNPKLVEDDVVRMAARRPIHGLAVDTLLVSRWLLRHRVVLALISNPWVDAEVSVPFLGLLTRDELRDVVNTPSLPAVVRATANELFERRPPLGEPDEDLLPQ